jgi:hypothetical protein
MSRLKRLLWLFLLVTSPVFADQDDSSLRKTHNPLKISAARSSDNATLRADKHGELLAPEHGTLILDERSEIALVDLQGAQVLADEHGTVALSSQQPVADDHGTLKWDPPPSGAESK